MYDFEKYASKANRGRSFKLFYPYMNDSMGNVCIVREVGEDGFFKSGIYDIFSIGYDYKLKYEETEYVKGFRFPNKYFDKDALINRPMNDSGFLLFALYIKEYYGIDFTEEYDKFAHSLWCRYYFYIERNNLAFYIYNTHRRTQHRCDESDFDYKKVVHGGMHTITEKNWSGFNSRTSCPLCLGKEYQMDYPEYKKLNEVHKFL